MRTFSVKSRTKGEQQMTDEPKINDLHPRAAWLLAGAGIKISNRDANFTENEQLELPFPAKNNSELFVLPSTMDLNIRRD